MTESMRVYIGYHPQFFKDIKRLSKKYKSLPTDYAKFLDDLEANPDLGVDLGHGLRKVRMSISSKGKGKSGGARVITYKRTIVTEEFCKLTLLSMYDKNEIENVSDSYIMYLIDTLD